MTADDQLATAAAVAAAGFGAFAWSYRPDDVYASRSWSSPEFARLFGLDKAAISDGDVAEALLDERERRAFVSTLATARRTGVAFTTKHAIARADGPMFVELTGAATRDDDGVHVRGLARAWEAAPVIPQDGMLPLEGGLYEWRRDTDTVFRDAGICALIGVAPHEAEPRASWWRDRVHPDDLIAVGTAKALDPLAVTTVSEYRVRHADGRWIWVWDHGRTEFDDAGTPLRVIGCTFSIDTRKRAEIAHAEAVSRLRIAQDAANLGIHDFDVESGIAEWDWRTRELWGVEPGVPITLEAFLNSLHPDDRLDTQAAVDAALDPNGAGRYYAEYRVRHAKTGQERWIAATGITTFEAGRAVRLVGTVQDISERKRAQARIDMLVGEVSHRSKNLLAVVSAIARQSATGDPESYVARFTARLGGLAASHDLLIGSEWGGLELRDLVRAQLAHFSTLIGDRIALNGGRALLRPESAQMIGMAIHELATNAAKYGALSVNAGHVDIAWSVDEDGLALSWTERDGPPVVAPSRRGFGQRVLVDMLRHGFAAAVDLEYAPTGLTWTMRAPATILAGAGAD